ncbi:MAG TPA: 50S ribosomal protein L24 [Chloroflexota bacterium]|nr:50S ribosomal protein L24 [Chloroflexota bacterium]
MAAKIRTGDMVTVLRGKDRGKTGRVRQVLPDENRLYVEGLNIVKRHQKARGPGQPGGIIEKEAPLHVSKVAVVDPQTAKPTRVGFRFEADGSKVRYAKRSGQVIPTQRPEKR